MMKTNEQFLFLFVRIPTHSDILHPSYTDMPIYLKIFLAQFDAIKKIASKEGRLILVGRCRLCTGREFDNVLSVFIHADMDARVRRICQNL